MDCDIYKQHQDENACQKQNERTILSDCEDLPIEFSPHQVVSAWRELPDKERIIILLVDLRHLGVGKVAEIMNKPVAAITKETKQARGLLKKKLLSNYQKFDFF